MSAYSFYIKYFFQLFVSFFVVSKVESTLKLSLLITIYEKTLGLTPNKARVTDKYSLESHYYWFKDHDKWKLF